MWRPFRAAERGARRPMSCSVVLIRNFSWVAAAVCWRDGAAIKKKNTFTQNNTTGTAFPQCAEAKW